MRAPALAAHLPATRTRVVLVAAALLAVAAALVAALVSRDAAVATAPYVNRAGGYRLEYPAGWKPVSIRSSSMFVSPDRSVVMGAGTAPAGSLRSAADAFRRAVLRSYEDVRVDGRQRETMAGREAFVLAGSATNRRGAPLRWMTVTLREGARNYGISVFTSASSDPRSVLPRVRTLVESFQPLA